MPWWKNHNSLSNFHSWGGATAIGHVHMYMCNHKQQIRCIPVHVSLSIDRPSLKGLGQRTRQHTCKWLYNVYCIPKKYFFLHVKKYIFTVCVHVYTYVQYIVHVRTCSYMYLTCV